MYVSLGVLNIYVRPGKELVHPVRYPKAAVIKKESWGRFSDQYCPTAPEDILQILSIAAVISITNKRPQNSPQILARFFLLHTNTHTNFPNNTSSQQVLIVIQLTFISSCPFTPDSRTRPLAEQAYTYTN